MLTIDNRSEVGGCRVISGLDSPRPAHPWQGPGLLQNFDREGTERSSEEKLAELVARRLHDRYGDLTKIRARSADGRRARHGRHGWLRQDRGRRKRTCVSCFVGGACPRYAASHALRRCLADRPFALREGTAATNYLSQRFVLPALGSRIGEERHRARLRDSRGTQGRSCHDAGYGAPKEAYGFSGAGRPNAPFILPPATSTRALQTGGSRTHQKHSSEDPHTTAALRAGQAGRCGAVPRLSRVS